jgi:hypothetical protein
MLAASNGARSFDDSSTSFLPEGEVRLPVNRNRSVAFGVKAFAGGASLDWQYTPWKTERLAAAVDVAFEYTQSGSDLFGPEGSRANRYLTVAPALLFSYRAVDWLEFTVMTRVPTTLRTGPEITALFGGNLSVKIGENLGIIPQGGLYFNADGRPYLNAGAGLFATFAQR